jgi:phosphate:Na+ symporter
MTVMTEGLKALAGSALRTVLVNAAATPWHGSFWGALVRLLVQSSSATTMTALTRPIVGANVGTMGTGWLVALIGVRVSLAAAAMPMIFVGPLTKLLARGRLSGSGAALAGFGLVLFGLTTLQQGMGGVAERLHPADLPAVFTGADGGWWRGMLGALMLVAAGLAMTAVMQSSTAAIAVKLSAFYAGAVGLDQGCVDHRPEHRDCEQFGIGMLSRLPPMLHTVRTRRAAQKRHRLRRRSLSSSAAP